MKVLKYSSLLKQKVCCIPLLYCGVPCWTKECHGIAVSKIQDYGFIYIGVKVIFFLWSLLPPANEVGKGDVFTGVCLSVHRGWQTPPPPADSQQAHGTHPTGMHSWCCCRCSINTQIGNNATGWKRRRFCSSSW